MQFTQSTPAFYRTEKTEKLCFISFFVFREIKPFFVYKPMIQKNGRKSAVLSVYK